ncbi:MFS transporter [Psychroserpens sp.]|uniref:MFS transporter n=1 Tax=Psychroserpens sp. TaxID=2020870 RepID=UPI002B27BBCF|nr:MFS transporter [Psychroserpens sp.]
MEKHTHTFNALLYAISNGIERASYYGIRSILILYMVSESLGMTRFEALGFYGWLTLSFYLSKVIGSLLGDLLIGNKLAILFGGLLQTLGCFLLCFSSMSFLYIGVGLLVIGNGLFSPNVLAQFGKQYSNKPKIIDAGFSGLFFFINIGAFLGVMLIGLVGSENFSYGFIFGGILMLLATLIGFFNTDEDLGTKKMPLNYINVIHILFVFVAITFSGIFWACYEMSSGLTSMYIFDSGLEFSHWMNITSGSGIVFTLILAIIWTFIYTNQFAKFCIGLMFSALALGLMISFSENSEEGSTMILIASGLLLALSEAFLSPMLYAITTKYSNPKYLAIILSVVSLPILIFNKIAGVISEQSSELNESTIFIVTSVILVVVAIIASIMWFVQKNTDKNGIFKKTIKLD